MEVINNGITLREDRQMLVMTHLSQLLSYITGFGGFLVPLILWLTNRDKVIQMDTHGKEILNFQISTFIYAIICVPAILLLGLGILGLIFLLAIGFIFPIINAVKASNGEPINYYISIRFFS